MAGQTCATSGAFRIAAAGLLATAFASPYAILAAASDHSVVAQSADSADLQWGPCPEFMPEGCEIAVLHGNPAQPNTDLLFKLAPGTTAERHWHTSAERMLLIEGELHVEFDGQPPTVMTPGTYAYGPAEHPHSAACRSDTPCTLFIAFEEPVDAFPGGAGEPAQ